MIRTTKLVSEEIVDMKDQRGLEFLLCLSSLSGMAHDRFERVSGGKLGSIL